MSAHADPEVGLTHTAPTSRDTAGAAHAAVPPRVRPLPFPLPPPSPPLHIPPPPSPPLPPLSPPFPIPPPLEPPLEPRPGGRGHSPTRSHLPIFPLLTLTLNTGRLMHRRGSRGIAAPPCAVFKEGVCPTSLSTRVIGGVRLGVGVGGGPSYVEEEEITMSTNVS
ncbi:hypothetical protein NMY22_g20254 [Coprinellus aureogranulatus]|nr:hypothetical protein NMY22_g20254 [Coprinellus aureogranulatus]